MTAAQRITDTVAWLQGEIATLGHEIEQNPCSPMVFSRYAQKEAYEACLTKLQSNTRSMYRSAAQIETFILDHLDKHGPLTWSQIHNALNLPPSSVYRALIVLQFRKQVTKENKLWSLTR